MAPSLDVFSFYELSRFVRRDGVENMIEMARNIYLMEYIKGSGQSRPRLEAVIKEDIAAQYKREQQFRHSNGTYWYSSWDSKDKVNRDLLIMVIITNSAQRRAFKCTVRTHKKNKLAITELFLLV